MSTLPNSIIRLVPPSLRAGYCPSTWTEFGSTVMEGTTAEFTSDNGSTFYNFGSTAPYPPAVIPPVVLDCQDFGIDWEPAAHELGQYIQPVLSEISSLNGATTVTFEATVYERQDGTANLPYLTFDSNTTVTTLSWPNATGIDNYVYIARNTALVTVSMPNVVTIGGGPDCADNSALTTLVLTNWIPNNSDNLLIEFQNNALTQASVDHVLARCVASPTWNKVLKLEGGTNATPSAAGLADKATLVGRGATVTNN